MKQYLDHVSFSSLKYYLQCPRQFFGKKIYLESTKDYNENLLIGTGVHAGFELFFNYMKEQKAISDKKLENHIGEVIDASVAEAAENGVFFSEHQVFKMKESATNIVTKNRKNIIDVINEDSTIYATELEIKLPLFEEFPNWTFEAHIDLVTQREGIYYLWDYKTVSRFWDETKKQSLEMYSSQLLFYKYLFHKYLNVPPAYIRTIFLMFRKRDCVIESWESYYTTKDLQKMLENVKNVFRAMKTYEFPCVAVPSDKICKYCSFWDQQEQKCKIADIDTELYIRQNYLVENI